jgi:hypothetical protein
MTKSQDLVFKKSELTTLAKSVSVAHVIQDKWAKHEPVPEKALVEYVKIMQEFLDVVRTLSIFYDKEYLTTEIPVLTEDLVDDTRTKLLDVINQVRGRHNMDPVSVDEMPEAWIDHSNLTFEEKMGLDAAIEKLGPLTIVEG